MSNFYDSAPRWEDKHCPNICPTAKPASWQKVSKASVIEVKGAKYRLATFDGVFLLANSEEAVQQSEQGRVKVLSCWFGHRLKSGAPISLLVETKNFTVIPNYSGLVVSNISR